MDTHRIRILITAHLPILTVADSPATRTRMADTPIATREATVTPRQAAATPVAVAAAPRRAAVVVAVAAVVSTMYERLGLDPEAFFIRITFLIQATERSARRQLPSCCNLNKYQDFRESSAT